jgi:hypothetical protein
MYYLKKTDEDFSAQLGNFANKINPYVIMFNLTADDVSQMEKDSAYFAWSLVATKRYDDTKKGWTGFKNNLRRGVPNVTTNPIPEPVVVTPTPGEVAPGVQYRFTTLVNRIKAHNSYTSAIGQVLGIENSSQNRIAFENVQPNLKVVMRGGKVNLDWKKGAYDGIVIEKDSGNGFVVFDKDMRPNFTDPTPLPPGSESAVWRYRAMFLYSDARVGNWSDVVTITVGD